MRSSKDKSGENRRGRTRTYLITSLRPRQCRGKLLIDLTRSYWGAVENGCHRVRDRDQAEDKCRARKENLAISILRMIGNPNIAEAMERNCYRPAQAVALATP